MEHWREPFEDRVESGDISQQEVEAYAQGLNDVLMMIGVWDGHRKSYDPLVIAETTEPAELDDWTEADIVTIPNPRAGETHLVAHSYLFDLWDGGRHHDMTGKTLKELVQYLRAEAAANVVQHGEHCEQYCKWAIEPVEGEPFGRGLSMKWKDIR